MTGPPRATASRSDDRQQVWGARRLSGTIRTPGDKSISHRALIIGALAEGTTTIRGLSDGEDVKRTSAAVVAFGARMQERADGVACVHGGRARLHAARSEIDCGNSGTTMRLLAGVAAGLRGHTLLVGDASLSGRPMGRVADPLRAMGAGVACSGPSCLPPLAIDGGTLRGIAWTPPVASAQVKSLVLLAGLAAEGRTIVTEPVATRAHTEELLAASGARIAVQAMSDGGRVVTVEPSSLHPIDLAVPGDPSQAAFWVVAACIVPDSDIRVEGVYSGPERTGFLGVLRRMGAQVTLVPGAAPRSPQLAETPAGPVADVHAASSTLRATSVDAAELPSLDEVPILAVAAAAAEGATIFADVGELRVKESDRIEGVISLVQAFGARAEAVGDELRVHGVGPRGRLTPGTFDARGDHRLAMAAAVAALAARTDHGHGSLITGFSSVQTSYPGFLRDLAALTGAPTAAPARVTIAIDGPAGSGKSTLSRLLAERLGLPRLDTGAMYRAVAWAALERGVDPADTEAVAALARDARIDVGPDKVHLDGKDVTTAIRSSAVNRVVSVVAANQEVRHELVGRQRRWAAAHGGGVVEGRDIGSVVLPKATLKVYLTATPDERARRREDEAPDGVARRDHVDSTRAASPLTVAPDAHVLDTTARSVEDVVQEVLGWL